MPRRGKVDQVVILKSKFKFEHDRVFFGRARLLPNCIILKGLGFKQIVRLDEIQEIRWSSDLLAIGLTDGTEIDLIIESAALWKFELQARCNLKDFSNESDLSDAPSTPTTEAGDGSYNGEHPVLAQRETSYKVRSAFAQDRYGLKRD